MKTICSRLRILLPAVAVLILGATAAAGQSPEAATAVQVPASQKMPAPEAKQPRKPLKRATTPPLARVTVIAGQAEVAPQVVTIVHRLSGIKMLRLLLRQAGERGTLATFDPQEISNDAHASIIAGWALEDGKTIAARLPQAAAELEFPQLFSPAGEFGGQFPGPMPPPAMASTKGPDLAVVTRDGRRLAVRYIGLDGQTGLSVLQIIGPNTPPLSTVGEVQTLFEGQRVQLFAPEQTEPAGDAAPGIIYVRVGEIEGEIANVTRAVTGKLERLTVRSGKLSPAVIGGIACDEAGNTLGIVDAIEGDDARIVPADRIRAATRRVLERQSSVPRPLLGIRGEPVEFAGRATFLAHGWREDQLPDLIRKQVGILLTSVMPGTPAALAKLHPGDVIVSVNNGDVKSAEEFSALLSQAGSGEKVQFSVKRPDSPAPVPVVVKLGGSFEPLFKLRFEMPGVMSAKDGLEALGAETIGLSPKVASQLGAQGGLLVVSVKPESAAARGGMREGDVIESIDGRNLRRGAWTLAFPGRQKKHVLSLIRGREKKQIVLDSVE